MTYPAATPIHLQEIQSLQAMFLQAHGEGHVVVFEGFVFEARQQAGLRVRVTGQQFFDGSHVPCATTGCRNPKRVSLWEIHLIYDNSIR